MTEEELLRRNENWERAIRERDHALADGVLHGDYALLIVVPRLAVVKRSEWLAMLPDYVVHEWTVEERIVDVREDLAVILQRVSMQATVSGKDRSGLFAISDIWRRDGDEWRVWRRHSTPLTAGDLPRG